MRLAPIFAVALFATTPAMADVDQAIDAHILPGYTAFAASTDALTSAAQADCTAAPLRPAYQAAYDAWMGVSHLRLGPVEKDGRILAIAFWPDPRGMTDKALKGLIADEDPVVKSPEAFANVSVAARGLFALERLLYDDALSGYAQGSYTCDLVTAISVDLDGMADDILAEWQDGFAETLRTGGAPDNATYLSDREALQALFTVLMTGLEFNSDQRLGRPMGTFDRPRPTRAEAWRSGRSMSNVVLSLKALRALAGDLSVSEPEETLGEFESALSAAQGLDDPIFAGVATPPGRLKVEVLQQAINGIREAAAAEIGPQLGVSAGFNAADGD